MVWAVVWGPASGVIVGLATDPVSLCGSVLLLQEATRLINKMLAPMIQIVSILVFISISFVAGE